MSWFFGGATEIVPILGVVMLWICRDNRRMGKFRNTTFFVRAGALTEDVVEEIIRRGGRVEAPSHDQALMMDQRKAPSLPDGCVALFGNTFLRSEERKVFPLLPWKHWKNEFVLHLQAVAGGKSGFFIPPTAVIVKRHTPRRLVTQIIRQL